MGGKYTVAQKKATEKYLKKNMEIVSFRVKKGKRKAYIELSKKRDVPLTRMLESYLDNECEKEGIEIVLDKVEEDENDLHG